MEEERRETGSAWGASPPPAGGIGVTLGSDSISEWLDLGSWPRRPDRRVDGLIGGMSTAASRREGSGWEVEESWGGSPFPTYRDDGDRPKMTRILLPYNGSTTANAAVKVVANLSRGVSTVVWVLYVMAWGVSRADSRSCLVSLDQARECAATALPPLRSNGVSTSVTIRDAPRERIPQAIAAEAENIDATYIVLGTHARRGLTAALLGSTSLAIARAATCTTLLVKVPQR